MTIEAWIYGFDEYFKYCSVCRTDNKWQDASVLLPRFSDGKTLIEKFLDENLTHDTRVMVDHMFAYLRKVPANEIVGNTAEKDKFIGWMKIYTTLFYEHNGR